MTKHRILLTYLLLVLLTISTLVVILPPVKAESTIWTVDDDSLADFSTIQDAVGVANNGDSAPITYWLNITVIGTGSTSPAAGSHIYEEGSEIAVKATDTFSDYGWLFEYWILDGYTIGKKKHNPLNLTMDKDHELIAVFFRAPNPPTYEPTPSPSPSPEPSATPTPTPSLTASPEPTPDIPELPFWAILPLFMITASLLVVFYFQKHKK